jgi:hypothetical protein
MASTILLAPPRQRLARGPAAAQDGRSHHDAIRVRLERGRRASEPEPALHPRRTLDTWIFGRIERGATVDFLPSEDSRGAFDQRMRRGRDLRTSALILGALVLVAVAVAKPWGSPPKPSSSVSPTALGTATAAPTATLDPREQAEAVRGCVTDRLVVTAAGATAAVETPPVLLPSFGKVAYVLGEAGSDSPADRRMVVVASPAGSRAVALVSSTEGVGSGWVGIRGWSADGSAFLVEAGRPSPSSQLVAGSCSDLYLVQADGTKVTAITANGPGGLAAGGTLVQQGHAVAYAELTVLEPARAGVTVHYRLSLRVAQPDVGLDREVLSCGLSLGTGTMVALGELVAASPDGSRLAVLCDQGVQTVDLQSLSSNSVLGWSAGLRTAVGWAADGLQVATVVEPQSIGARRLTIERAGWRGGGESSAESSSMADWATAFRSVSFSPDGTRLLAKACANPSPGDCLARFAVVDVATGSSQVVYQATRPSTELDARWLPGGREIAIGQDGVAGSVICQADGSGTVERSDLPPDAEWWPGPL